MNNLSGIIHHHLPEYLNEDYQVFVAFIQAYFQETELDGNFVNFFRDFQDAIDIDKANDSFIQEFYDEFCQEFPPTDLIEKKTLIKNIKEFYLAKGAEQSFRFIFTVLFNAKIEFFYPREVLHSASGGEYIEQDFIYTTAVNREAFSLFDYNNELTLVGITSGSTAILDSIETFMYSGDLYLKIKIASYDKPFTSNEQVKIFINNAVISETIIDSINDINILDGGNNYTIKDKITVYSNVSGSSASFKIEKVSLGGFDDYIINDGGIDYEIGDIIVSEPQVNSYGYGFSAEVSAVDINGSIQGIRIFDNGEDYSRKTNAVITTTNGSGADIELIGDVGSIEKIKIIDSGYVYITPEMTIDTISGSGFDYEILMSPVYNKEKSYITNDDWLSSDSKIQDSFYYQQFSYVIKTYISPDDWLDVIKTNLHPVGSRVFAHWLREDLTLPSLAPSLYDENGEQFSSLILVKGRESSSINIPIIDAERDTTIVVDLYNVNIASSGLTYWDIDRIKFWDSFDYNVGDLKYVIFDQFTYPNSNKYTLQEKQESTEILIGSSNTLLNLDLNDPNINLLFDMNQGNEVYDMNTNP